MGDCCEEILFGVLTLCMQIFAADGQCSFLQVSCESYASYQRLLSIVQLIYFDGKVTFYIDEVARN